MFFTPVPFASRIPGGATIVKEGAFEGKYGKRNAVLSGFVLAGGITMGYFLHAAHTIADVTDSAFRKVDHTVLSTLLTGSMLEALFLTILLVVVTVGLFLSLMVARDRLKSFIIPSYLAVSVLVTVLACIPV